MENFLYKIPYENEDYPDYNEILVSNEPKDSIFYCCIVALLQIVTRGRNDNRQYSENVREGLENAIKIRTIYSEDPIIIDSNEAMQNALKILSDDRHPKSQVMDWLWQYILPSDVSLSTCLMFFLKNIFFSAKLNINKSIKDKLTFSESINNEDCTEILFEISNFFGVYIELVDRTNKITEIRKSTKSYLPRITIFQTDENLYCLGLHKELKEFDNHKSKTLNLNDPPFTLSCLDESIYSNLTSLTRKTEESKIIPSYDLPVTETNKPTQNKMMSSPRHLIPRNRQVSPNSMNNISMNQNSSNQSSGPFPGEVCRTFNEKPLEREIQVAVKKKKENSTLDIADPIEFHSNKIKSMVHQQTVLTQHTQKNIKREKLSIIEGTDPEFEKYYNKKKEKLKTNENLQDSDESYDQISDFSELMMISLNLLNTTKELKYSISANFNKIEEIFNKNFQKTYSKIKNRKNKKMASLKCSNCGRSYQHEEFELFECGLKCLVCMQCRMKQYDYHCSLCNRKFTQYEISVLKAIKT